MASHPGHRNAAAFFEVTRLVECRRCGCGNLAWAKTAEGKFYLVNTTPDGRQASRFDRHDCERHREMMRQAVAPEPAQESEAESLVRRYLRGEITAEELQAAAREAA